MAHCAGDDCERRAHAHPLSSPAWSLDRLRIRYQRGARVGWIQSSSEDKQAFLLELASRDPALRLEGDRLSRVG